MLQDVIHALRQLRLNPAFFAIAICVIALGIGAKAGITLLSRRSRSRSKRAWRERIPIATVAVRVHALTAFVFLTSGKFPVSQPTSASALPTLPRIGPHSSSESNIG